MSRAIHSAPRKLLAGFLAALILTGSLPAVQATETEAVPETETTAETHTLYLGPAAGSGAVGSFADGDTVTLLERTGKNWSRIRLKDGTTGYCDAGLLGVVSMTTETEAEAVLTGALTRTACTVYSSPEEDAVAAGQLPANTAVRVSGELLGSFWTVLLRNGTIGYLQEEDLVFQYAQPALVRTVPTFPETGAVTEAEAAERLQALSAYFQHGLYWNCVGTGKKQSKENLFTLTENPCIHASYGYTRCNIYTGTLCNADYNYSMAMQCYGYVNLLSDLVFGTEAPVYTHGDFEKLKVGDHIRLVLWDHSMLVTEVCKDENGRTYVYVTDVNADYENCMIQWGRKFTQQDLRRLGDYIRVQTRYPLE